MTFLSHLHIILCVPIVYFGYWTDDHYCTNSLSSLHISSHHCTFCAYSGGSRGLIQPWPPSSLTVEFAPFNEEIAVETEDYTNLGLLSRMFTLHAPLISREA